MALVIDTETDGFLADVTKMWMLGVYDERTKQYTEYSDYTPGARPLEEGLALLQTGEEIVGHNILGYDWHVLKKLFGIELPLDKVWDTQVMSRLHNPSKPGGHSLDNLGTTWFESAKHEFTDYSKWSPEMSPYMKQDVRITVRVWNWLRKELAEWGESVRLEHDFAFLMALQMQNGFRLDVTQARILLAELSGTKAELEAELCRIFPPIQVINKTFTPKRDDKKRGYVKGVEVTTYKTQEFSPGSRQQIAKRLMDKYGWKPTVFTETGIPEISEETLATLTFPEVPTLLAYLGVEKKIGMLDGKIKKNGSGGGWLKHEKNGRVYGYVNSNGAVTGRCTHSKPNVAQADSDESMRSLWLPRIGWVLLGSDAEGIEARALGHYLAVYDAGAYSTAVVSGDKKLGTDTHTMNKNILKMFNRGGEGQIGAKNFLYALIYGAGDAKLGKLIIQDAIDAGKYNETDAPWLFETTKKGKVKPRSQSSLGAEGRERIESGLTGFGQLIMKIKRAVKNNGFIKGLDGRKLWIRSTHSALNSLLQGFGAIIMKKALVLFHQRQPYTYGADFAYCANVHDEVQIECRTEEIAHVLGKLFGDCIRDAGEHFKSRCPQAGTYKIGPNWSHTH